MTWLSLMHCPGVIIKITLLSQAQRKVIPFFPYVPEQTGKITLPNGSPLQEIISLIRGRLRSNTQIFTAGIRHCCETWYCWLWVWCWHWNRQFYSRAEKTEIIRQNKMGQSTQSERSYENQHSHCWVTRLVQVLQIFPLWLRVIFHNQVFLKMRWKG